MTETEEIKIAAPKLMPYMRDSHYVCRACGFGLGWWMRAMTLMRAMLPNIVSMRYCAGGKAPTEMAGMAEILHHGTFSIERLNECAGLNEPHLHVTCRNCGHERLMKTKTSLEA